MTPLTTFPRDLLAAVAAADAGITVRVAAITDPTAHYAYPPVVLWQIPVGNMAQNNTTNHYKDDKVDWFFAHLDQVADAHVAALLFGAGQQEQTGVETDGGNLINKTIAYRNSGGTALK